MFRVIKEKTKDYWLELEGTDGGMIIDGKKEIPIWNIHVVCKWDGCVNYWDYSNGYSWNHKCEEGCQCCEQYIHICSVDNFIETLGKIKELGRSFYKGKSGEEYWE